MDHEAGTRELFEALGFVWDRHLFAFDAVAHGVERACFRMHKLLANYVWDACVLEGNPFTFPQVQTILDGITVGGHRLSDEDQVRNLAASTKALIRLVRSGSFSLDKRTFCALHALVAREEAMEWGHFRGEGAEKNYTPHVGLGGAEYVPPATGPAAVELNRIFDVGVGKLEQHAQPPVERAIAFFLFGALQQFFFDGNKRTSRLMMNGVLMSHGIDAISIPAARAQEFNEKMVRFYLDRDASEMMDFVLGCHPDAVLMRAAASASESSGAPNGRRPRSEGGRGTA